VAALVEKDESSWVLNERDLQTFTTKDSGPGGQHRNKTESCVVMRHIPTGIEAKAASKSQHANRRTARAILEARVAAHLEHIESESRSAARRAMIGSGMRGDKIRTYREQDDSVVDDRSGRRTRLSDIRKNGLEKLWG